MTRISPSIRPKEAADFLGIGISTLWRWVKNRDDFPMPRKLSPRCTVFDTKELMDWRDAAPPVHGLDRLH